MYTVEDTEYAGYLVKNLIKYFVYTVYFISLQFIKKYNFNKILKIIHPVKD